VVGARIHLGQLWSSSVTRKEHHHVVDTGPYAIVRHPIYTGLLIAIVATMLMRGTIITLTGSAIIAVGIYVKACVEEECRCLCHSDVSADDETR
jgi:protein-S-isoprenylcysteine O-methyltransferase Ste14